MTPSRDLCLISGQQHANIITLFQFNSRIFVVDSVVEICDNGMFLEFHEFEMKYRAAVMNGIEPQYILKYNMLNYIVGAREVIAVWYICWLQFDLWCT